jgi:hypothetical protein
MCVGNVVLEECLGSLMFLRTSRNHASLRMVFHTAVSGIQVSMKYNSKTGKSFVPPSHSWVQSLRPAITLFNCFHSPLLGPVSPLFSFRPLGHLSKSPHLSEQAGLTAAH